MKRPRKNGQKNILKKIRRIHTAVSTVLFFSYVFLSLSYSPEFLFSDIKSKFSALADETVTITARVLAPPVKPIVSISGACDASVFKISLAWPGDENSTSFDISRDGFPLVTGTSFLSYVDSNTAIDTTYTYVVTAHGPMGSGFANSDPAVITSPHICGSGSEQPTVTLAPLNPNDGFYTIINTTRPRFSGTTNIPYAIIDLEIHSQQIISGQTLANVNGYWSWDPPLDITNGIHTLYVTVTDPLDPSRTVSGQLYFIVNFTNGSSSSSSNSSKKNEKHSSNPAAITATSSEQPEPPTTTGSEESFVEIPLAYSLNFEQDSIQQGKNINPIVIIERLEPKYEGSQAELSYAVYDQKGKLILTEKDAVILAAGKNIGKNISLPSYLKDGDYQLKTVLTFDSFIIGHEHFFQITPALFLHLGGNIFITYPEFLSNIGTASILLLLLLLIWLYLFSREYWLYLHALRHITEKNLERLGLISAKKRKGVSR